MGICVCTTESARRAPAKECLALPLQLLDQRTQRLRAMTVAVFLERLELRCAELRSVRQKYRVVTEATRAARRLQNPATPATGRNKRIRIVGSSHQHDDTFVSSH